MAWMKGLSASTSNGVHTAITININDKEDEEERPALSTLRNTHNIQINYLRANTNPCQVCYCSEIITAGPLQEHWWPQGSSKDETQEEEDYIALTVKDTFIHADLSIPPKSVGVLSRTQMHGFIACRENCFLASDANKQSRINRWDKYVAV
ncbi:hypothetical protein WISP_98684 [Willisornis vidua]|uniref:Uncharacterized protein n=1 Tax=Willisornis vidua TaxID=1566151 RepID=A0ABQ9CZ79_9PASS|nr:hypothetical protein WISP_98684 [Willisornis vidua]